MNLEMYAIAVNINDRDEVELSQIKEGVAARLTITVEQVPFLIDLLYQIKTVIEDRRASRQESA